MSDTAVPGVPTAPVPLPVAVLAVLAAAVVPAVLWWTVGQPVLQLGVIVLVLVAHERLGRSWAARRPADAVPSVVPTLRTDLLIPVALAGAILASILLLELGLGLDVWDIIGPFTPIAPALILIREVTMRVRRKRARSEVARAGRP